MESRLVAREAPEAALQAPAHEIVDSSSDGGEEQVNGVSTTQQAGEEADDDGVDDDEEVEVEINGDDIWDSDSLIEQTVSEIMDANLPSVFHDYICTLEEAKQYRNLLIALGPVMFFERTVEGDVVTARKLVTAFGIVPPDLPDNTPDHVYYDILSIAVDEYLHGRTKLSHYNTVDDVVDLLRKAQNIVVITGAGISTSLGIPDFRSKDTGLYSKLAACGLDDPQEVFDITVFKENPEIFFSIAKDILPETKHFSPTHAFIKLLHDKGKLLTNYTQNIDNLESWAGIPSDKLIQCHGSFATATCTKCQNKLPGDAIFADIKRGIVPKCKKCIALIQQTNAASGMKRKRSQSSDRKKRERKWGGSEEESSSEDEGVIEAGIMKPDITFFGESLPDTFGERLTKHDKDLVDLVVVIGTSLKVAPVSEVIPFLRDVPQVYISRTPVNHLEFDVDMLGDCDVVVAELAKRAGWELKHEMIPDNQVITVQAVEGYQSRHLFTAVSS